MTINATDSFGVGVQFQLTGQEDLRVGQGVTVTSTLADAIRANAGRHTVNVFGTVVSDQGNGIILEGASRSEVVIGTNGMVLANNNGVSFGAAGSEVTNRGLISAGFHGIVATSDADVGTTVIINSGTILAGNDGVHVTGDGKVTITNTGTITGGTNVVETGDGRDFLRNEGLLVADAGFAVLLGFGDDRYDGRGGRVQGNIDLGFDDDVARPGGGSEDIAGNGGTDLLDFHLGGGVRVALDGSFTSSGTAARGDTYSGFENISGSDSGNDRLTGNNQANVLRGNGGDDTLSGGDGADTIVGGVGDDVLDGGDLFASDHFVFDRPSHGGDTITGFLANDRIVIDDAGFGINLEEGVLSANRIVFHSSRQAADANDRFIFDTRDASLWFDRDGTGSEFRSVLIVDTSSIVFHLNNILIV
jgi:RTX calcium-binding nonapeptide repeat (4 copies)